MIKTFVHEIDKQIASNRELYEKTKMDIFKQRILKLEAQKSDILKNLKGFIANFA
jgi:hypothetical protein